MAAPTAQEVSKVRVTELIKTGGRYASLYLLQAGIQDVR